MGKLASSFWRTSQGVVALALIIAIWEILGRIGEISPLALPLPSSVMESAGTQLFLEDFWINWKATALRWMTSFIIGLLSGGILGFVSGMIGTLRRLLLPPFSYVRAIPPITLFPIALVALGVGELPLFVVSSLSCALYVFPLALESARRASGQYRELASVLNVSGAKFLALFILPATMFSVGSFVRVAATVTFVVCIAGEVLVGGGAGVGVAIVNLTERYELSDAYVYVLATGVLGILIDFAGAQISKRSRSWEPGLGRETN